MLNNKTFLLVVPPVFRSHFSWCPICQLTSNTYLFWWQLCEVVVNYFSFIGEDLISRESGPLAQAFHVCADFVAGPVSWHQELRCPFLFTTPLEVLYMASEKEGKLWVELWEHREGDVNSNFLFGQLHIGSHVWIGLWRVCKILAEK